MTNNRKFIIPNDKSNQAHTHYWPTLDKFVPYNLHDSENLVLLCRKCHTYVHNQHVFLTTELGYPIEENTFKLALT
jgi:5-methylcytosine-specific restriction endonuclease McrA